MVETTITEVPREVHTTAGVFKEYESREREYVRPGGMVVDIQRRGGGVMGSPEQKAAAEKARLATLEMRRLQEIKRQEQAAASQKAAQTQQQIQQQVQAQTVAGQLQARTKGWLPQYQEGKLIGFQKDKEFLPKEITIGKEGAYQPWAVTTPGKVVAPGGAGYISTYTSPTGIIGTLKEAGRKGEKAYEFEVPTDKGRGVYRWEEGMRTGKREFPLATKMELASALQEGREVYYTPEGARVEQKIGGVLGGLITKYKEAQKFVREKVTHKVLPETELSFGTAAERKKEIWRGEELLPSIFRTPKFMRKIGETEFTFTKGYYRGIREKPVKTVALTGAFFAAPYVLGKVGAVGGFVAAKTGLAALPGYATTTATISSVVKVGLPVAYGTSVYLRVKAEPTREKRIEKLGEIAATEVTPMFAGGIAGAKIIPKVRGWWATRGRAKIPTEKLVPQEIILGKKRFVEAPGEKISARYYKKLFLQKSQRLPGFEKEPVLYHAAGGRFWKSTFEAAPGTSYDPGLYGAYRISPHFLRTQGSLEAYGGGLFTGYGKPGVLAVAPKKFVTGRYTWQQFYAGVKPKPGVAYIPGVKPEVEAVLPPGTAGQIVSKQFYFKWKGVRIPIDVGRVTGIEAAKPTGKIPITELASYYKPVSYPITTPSSYLLGTLSSYVSKVSSSRKMVSRVSSAISKRDYQPSYISKAVSYKPSLTSGVSRGYYDYGVGYGFKPSYYPYGKPKARPPVTPPPVLAWFREAKRLKYPRVKKIPVQPQKYTPSLTAAIFRIKAPKPKPILGKFKFGFLPGIRPLPF